MDRVNTIDTTASKPVGEILGILLLVNVNTHLLAEWSIGDVKNWIASLAQFAQFVNAFAFTNGFALVKLSPDALVSMGLPPPAAEPLLIEIAALQPQPARGTVL